MTLEGLKDILRRIEYKPGFGYSLKPSLNRENVDLFITLKVTDAEDFSRTVRISHASSKTMKQLSGMTEDIVIRWIRNAIIELEIHEVNEFLKFDGGHVVEPH